MNKDNPALNWSMNGAACLLLLPMITYLVFAGRVGITSLFSGAATLVAVTCIIGYLVAIWLVLRRGRLTAAAMTVFLCGYLQLGIGSGLAQRDGGESIYQLDFQGSSPQRGVDVFCNGVHLGTTPFMLTEAEFLEKVTPWKSPPKQPRVQLRGDSDLKVDDWGQYTWTPSDVFAEIRDHRLHQAFLNDETKFNAELRSAKYWWRFERDDCVALRRIGSLSGGGGGGRVQTYGVDLSSLLFPSQEPHFNRILEAARAADYRPDQQWIRHFLRYQPFFENELFQLAGNDRDVAGLIDFITAAKYDLPDRMEDILARERLQSLLDEVTEAGSFTIPSLNAHATVLIANRFPRLISDAFEREMRTFRQWSSTSRAGHGGWITWSGNGSYVRLQLLTEALIRTQPSNAFDRLVYEASGAGFGYLTQDRLMTAIGNYDRPEVAPILRKYFKDRLESDRDSSGSFRFSQSEVLNVMAEVKNRDVLQDVYRHIRREFPLTGIGANHDVIRFFERRIAQGDDPAELGNAIMDCNGLRDRDKGPLLWRLHTPEVDGRLAYLIHHLTRYELRELISEVRRSKINPFCSGFLIAARRELKRQQPNFTPGIDPLLLKIDSPAARDYIMTALKESEANEWSWMVDDVTGPLPHLDWLVPELASADLFRKRVSCRLLSAIGTDRATQLLNDWSTNDSQLLATAAQKALQDPAIESKESPIQNALVDDAIELIAGRMLPDDLLPPATSLVWTGQNYEIIPADEPATVAPDSAPEVAADTPAADAESVAERTFEATVRPTLEETIATLKQQGELETAEYLTARLKYAMKQIERRGSRFIFGRVVVPAPENPRLCGAQMPIHDSGWFVGSVGKPELPVGFRMWGYHPAEVFHRGPPSTIVNVGDVILDPYRFEELATVRAELVFEGSVDPAKVEVKVILGHSRTNSATGGTDGSIARPDKENVSLGQDFKLQKTGLSPLPHYITIKGPRHQPVRREFTLEPGGTTDIGVIRIAASKQFDIDIATSDSANFTNAKRRQQTVFVGDRFQTNPDELNYVGKGPLTLAQQKDRYYFHCGYSGDSQIDLGEGTLDDFLSAEVPDTTGKPSRNTDLLDGHVYLIRHRMDQWKHWTLIHVKISAPPQDMPSSAKDKDTSDSAESNGDAADGTQ